MFTGSKKLGLLALGALMALGLSAGPAQAGERHGSDAIFIGFFSSSRPSHAHHDPRPAHGHPPHHHHRPHHPPRPQIHHHHHKHDNHWRPGHQVNYWQDNGHHHHHHHHHRHR